MLSILRLTIRSSLLYDQAYFPTKEDIFYSLIKILKKKKYKESPGSVTEKQKDVKKKKKKIVTMFSQSSST